MLVDLWTPSPHGMMLRNCVFIRNARPIWSDAHVYGAFELEIPRVVTVLENRLWQYRKGGFFVKGQSEAYRSPDVTFIEPFATLLARAVRAEVLAFFQDRDGYIPDAFEHLGFFAEEAQERLRAPQLHFSDAITIIPEQVTTLGARLQFTVILGGSIRIRGCRIFGERARHRLVMPGCSGSYKDPIIVERPTMLEILRRAENQMGPASERVEFPQDQPGFERYHLRGNGPITMAELTEKRRALRPDVNG